MYAVQHRGVIWFSEDTERLRRIADSFTDRWFGHPVTCLDFPVDMDALNGLVSRDYEAINLDEEDVHVEKEVVEGIEPETRWFLFVDGVRDGDEDSWFYTPIQPWKYYIYTVRGDE